MDADRKDGFAVDLAEDRSCLAEPEGGGGGPSVASTAGVCAEARLGSILDGQVPGGLVDGEVFAIMVVGLVVSILVKFCMPGLPRLRGVTPALEWVCIGLSAIVVAAELGDLVVHLVRRK